MSASRYVSGAELGGPNWLPPDEPGLFVSPLDADFEAKRQDAEQDLIYRPGRWVWHSESADFDRHPELVWQAADLGPNGVANAALATASMGAGAVLIVLGVDVDTLPEWWLLVAGAVGWIALEAPIRALIAWADYRGYRARARWRDAHPEEADQADRAAAITEHTRARDDIADYHRNRRHS